MSGLSPAERATLERLEKEPMLGLVQSWAEVNSGSTNLAGLAKMAGLLADAFASLPGRLTSIATRGAAPTPTASGGRTPNAPRSIRLANGSTQPTSAPTRY